MRSTEPGTQHPVANFRWRTDTSEHWLELADGIDTQLADYFLVSVRCGCFMQAARNFNIKSSQLRKQLSQLEQRLGHSLFSFKDSVLTLSREGQQLHARLVKLGQQRRSADSAEPLIRLAVAEAILHDILARDLISLLRRNASLRLEIISLDNDAALQAAEADVVLWLGELDSPLPGPRFATGPARPLASVEYLAHIAKRYCRTTVRPNSQEDLTDYRLVQRPHNLHIESFQPWNSVVEQRLAGVVQVNDYALMLEMVRCSACIGLLPDYIGRFDRGLTALPGLFDEPMRRRVWLAVNSASDARPEVQALLDVIDNAFYERADWFGQR